MTRMQDNYLGLLGIEMKSAEEGHSVVTVRPERRHYNPQGRIHGGLTASIIDTAMGYAVYSKLPEGTAFGTVDLKVSFTGRIDDQSGVLTARGTVIHAGRTMLTAEAKLTDETGRLVGHGTGTFLVYPKK